MKHHFGIILVLLLMKIINSNNILVSAARFHSENMMSEFLKKLIDNDFLTYTMNIQISVETETKLAKWNFGDTMGQFLATVHEKKILIELRDSDAENRSPFDLHARVLFIDTFDSLRILLTKQRPYDHDLSAENQHYYIILSPEVRLANLQTFLEQIMHFCLINFIVNLNVLVETKDEKVITAYTYYPFTEEKCRNYAPIIHNRYINGSLQFNDQQTFPSKLNNFWECPLLIVLSEEPPFVVVKDNTISGIDEYYIKALAGIMNFSINAILAEGTGKIGPDGTLSGAFKMIEDGIGDLSIGGSYCSVDRKNRFSSTTDYFTSYLRIIVKGPKPYSSLEILLLPFDSYTWFTLLIILMAKWIGNVFWRRNSIDMGNFEESSARLHMLTWLFSILVLQSSYGGAIFKFLHNSPKRELPSDIEQALADGYKVIAKSTYYTALKQFSEFSDRFTFVDVSMSELIEEFNNSEEKYALVTLGEFIANRSEESKHSDIITVKKPIVQNIFCIYLPKFSFLTNELNRRIKQLKFYGHLTKFYEKPVQYTDSKGKNKKVGKDVNIMSLNQLLGAFQLLAVLMGLAIWLFLMEVISMHLGSLKKFMEFVH